jgi:ATP-dependent RNA helicase DeaD
MKTFKELGISPALLTVVKKLGFTIPTQIQEKSIPHIVKGKDVIGESATGSGKTLAFGCGIVERCIPKQGIQALVLTPTRELTEQVKEDLKKLARQKQLNITAVYGGVAIGPQMRALSTAEVVVATPGRLLDHLQRRTINISKVKILVLDEADRMFDMGFIDDVERIIHAIPRKRQTLFFSATMSSRVQELAKRHMRSPLKVFGKRMVDPRKLKQVYYDVMGNMKISLLVYLLKKERSGLSMVFCNTRNTTDFVKTNLKANKIDAIAIHGGMTQSKRTKTSELFNKGKVGVLICTDVAARGLHIEQVSHVYNYEIPRDPKDYIHRIGRTARAGEYGKVINLLCDRDHANFSKIQREYRDFDIEKAKRPYLEKIRTISPRTPRRGPPRRSGHHSRRGPPRRSSGSRSGSPRHGSRERKRPPRRR